MKIGRFKTKAKQFFYDDCHKIYIIESQQDITNFLEKGWTTDDILDIEYLTDIYANSCSLRFISNCSLTKQFARQFQDKVTFVLDNGTKIVVENKE